MQLDKLNKAIASAAGAPPQPSLKQPAVTEERHPLVEDLQKMLAEPNSATIGDLARLTQRLGMELSFVPAAFADVKAAASRDSELTAAMSASWFSEHALNDLGDILKHLDKD